MQNTVSSTRIIYGFSDIYYVTKSKMKDFLTVASVFFKHGTFVEVAVPSTLLCTNKANLIVLKGDPQSRKLQMEKINMLYSRKKQMFYHTIKWSNVLNNNILYKQLYCNVSQDLYTIQ